jgi:activator of Hsp90 ATPase-like protein
MTRRTVKVHGHGPTQICASAPRPGLKRSRPSIDATLLMHPRPSSYCCGATLTHTSNNKRRSLYAKTIRLHRVLRTTPEKLYRVFLDPAAKAKWLPPHGFTGMVHHMDARVGGKYKMS